MPNKDYYYIAYKILRYLYDCLMRGERPDLSLLEPGIYSIEEYYWSYIFRKLKEGDYIEGINEYKKPFKEETLIRFGPDFNITPKGIDYLNENSVFNKGTTA